jgi:hypothetical protein
MKCSNKFMLGCLMMIVTVAPALSFAGGKGGNRGGGGSGGNRSFSGRTMGNGRSFSSAPRNFSHHGTQKFHQPNWSAQKLPLNSNRFAHHANRFSPGNLNPGGSMWHGNKLGDRLHHGNFETRSISFSRNHAAHIAKHIHSDRVHHDFHRHYHHAPHHHVIRHRHAHWWLRFACGVHHYHHRPWVCYEGYWDRWRPCSYAMVPYYGYNYYVGMECVTIPDVNCLGVASVQPDSPAALAGLRAGDVIVSVNGKPLASQAVLTQEIPTEQLSLEVLRDGDTSPTLVSLIPRKMAIGQ